MGSSRLTPHSQTANENLKMADEKKSIKGKLLNVIRSVFHKNKKEEKNKTLEKENKVPTTSQNDEAKNQGDIHFQMVMEKYRHIKSLKENEPRSEKLERDKDTDSDLVEGFNKLQINKNDYCDNAEEDEEQKFSTKVITTRNRGTKIDSQTSDESGFADVSCDEDEDDDILIQSRQEIKNENAEKDVDRIEKEADKKDSSKEKRKQFAYLRRAPFRNKLLPGVHAAVQPYPSINQTDEINQINTRALSGGQVKINAEQWYSKEAPEQNHLVPNVSLSDDDLDNQIATHLTSEEVETCFKIAEEYIMQEITQSDIDLTLNTTLNAYPNPQAFDQFSQERNASPFSFNDFQGSSPSYLTPPNSVHSNCLYSPTRHTDIPSPGPSPQSLNSEGEVFREIVPSEYPLSCSVSSIQESPSPPTKHNLSHYKARQKELANKFSKNECCQPLKPCKEIFKEHLQKLNAQDRKGLSLSVAKLDLKFAYRVLARLLSDLSKSSDPDDVQMVLFSMICDKVVNQQKSFFIEDSGFALLKFAVLRCNHRAVITRYLVECVRAATRDEAYRLEDGVVFPEVDALGDNLLIACVRKGDACASVLRELVRAQPDDVPLLDVHHVNTDGYTALHVCCAEHGASTPRAHTLHVLLQHANADLWRKGRKEGDTPLHRAVISANCDLDIIMIIFKHIDRSEWYSLAHIKNGSSKTPIDCAKLAKKSRASYPREILDFLEKCRKSSKEIKMVTQ